MAKTDLYSTFVTDRIGTLSGTIDGIGVTHAAGSYFSHVALTGWTGSTWATPVVLATQLTTDLVANSITVTYNAVTLQYRIKKSINFSFTLGALLAKTMGYTTAAHSGSNQYDSDVRPYRVIRPMLLGQSAVSDISEPPGVVQQVVSDGGIPYGVSTSGAPLLDDWTHEMEVRTPPLSILGQGSPLTNADATALVPYSWYQFFVDARAADTCALYDPNTGAAKLFMLRGDGAAFTQQTRKRKTPDFDPLWSVTIQSYNIGSQ